MTLGGIVEGLDFDPDPLREFLRGHFGSTVDATVTRVEGGQSNPTYFLDLGRDRLVLRKQPLGALLPGAHAIDREFRVLTALCGTNVPVPRPILFHADPSLLGTPFYVMERVEGRIFHAGSLPSASLGERKVLYFAMAETLARLHAVRPADVGLDDFGRPGNYFERQLARWTKQWRQSPTKGIPALDELADWLADHVPPDDGRPVIAHGDFRLGNLLFHPKRAEVVAILDWELSTIGDPFADLGFACLPWNTGPDEYGGLLGLDLDELGIPSQREFVARYEASQAPASPLQLQPFHIAFALFRFAVIFVGIADRAHDGTAAASGAAALGPLAARFAARGMQLAERGYA